MIKIRIRNDGSEINVLFPIRESELKSRLAKIHVPYAVDKPNTAFVAKVYWPEELSILESKFANLDELNYLAQRLGRLGELKIEQFLVAVSKIENPTEKDLINLTFNLDLFTLVQDVSSMAEIGREYVMNTEGTMAALDDDDPKYTAIGKDLIARGLAQLTERGLLIYDPCDELREVYDGHTFPEYYPCAEYIVSVEIKYNGQTEKLLLPDEEYAIQKAIQRIGAPSAKDCTVSIDVSNIDDEVWTERIQRIINKEGIYKANAMLSAISAINIRRREWDELSAAIEFIGVESACSITILTEHLDDFFLLPRAESMEDVGHFMVSASNRCALNINMEKFFDFSGFGEYMTRSYNYKFVSGGFIYYFGDMCFDELLEYIVLENEKADAGEM